LQQPPVGRAGGAQCAQIAGPLPDATGTSKGRQGKTDAPMLTALALGNITQMLGFGALL